MTLHTYWENVAHSDNLTTKSFISFDPIMTTLVQITFSSQHGWLAFHLRTTNKRIRNSKRLPALSSGKACYPSGWSGRGRRRCLTISSKNSVKMYKSTLPRITTQKTRERQLNSKHRGKNQRNEGDERKEATYTFLFSRENLKLSEKTKKRLCFTSDGSTTPDDSVTGAS